MKAWIVVTDIRGPGGEENRVEGVALTHEKATKLQADCQARDSVHADYGSRVSRHTVILEFDVQ